MIGSQGKISAWIVAILSVALASTASGQEVLGRAEFKDPFWHKREGHWVLRVKGTRFPGTSYHQIEAVGFLMYYDWLKRKNLDTALRAGIVRSKASFLMNVSVRIHYLPCRPKDSFVRLYAIGRYTVVSESGPWSASHKYASKLLRCRPKVR